MKNPTAVAAPVEISPAERISQLEESVRALTTRLERFERAFPASMLREFEILQGATV